MAQATNGFRSGLMRRWAVRAASLGGTLLALLGSGIGRAHAQTAWINELHYDNTGIDAGEFIEVAVPTSTTLSTLSVVLYNGADGTTYGTHQLTSFTPGATVGGVQLYSKPIPSGIQNGAPDGLALVQSTTVLQFLSYEGTFAATNGAAAGQTSTSIGVSQSGNEPVGASLGLTGTGSRYTDFTWTAFATATGATPGQPNGGQTITAAASSGGTIFPGLTGQRLRDSLRVAYTPKRTLGYNKARDTLYAIIEGTVRGEPNVLRGVYSGFTITLDPALDPTTDANNKGINAEHTWPQSLGAASEPMASDMHHLYPSKINVNAARANDPLVEIPDAETDIWYFDTQSQTTPPSSNRDLWSEKDNTSTPQRFEPREQHKGNAARSLAYFYTIYSKTAGVDTVTNWQYEKQPAVLLAWHRSDPSDQVERDRSQLIAKYQGKVNPYTVDSTLIVRAFFPNLYAGDTALPVELAAFSAVRDRAGVRLRWQTASEHDNAGFEVRRDGRVLATFRSAPELIGAGTSPVGATYEWRDRTASSDGTHRYRLRSYDRSGAVHDHALEAIVGWTESGDPVRPDAFALLPATPNPFNPTTRIGYDLPGDGHVAMQVFDVLGRPVATLVDGFQLAGTYHATFDATGLSSGVYLVRLTAGRFSRTERMLLAR